MKLSASRSMVAIATVVPLLITPIRASAATQSSRLPSAPSPICSKLVHTETTEYGDRVYTYGLRGQTLHIKIPAKGFDARSATDRRIKALGYPKRPRRGTLAYARWLRAFGGHPQQSAGIPKGPCILPGTGIASIPSANYSGYQEYGTSGANVIEVDTNYIAPSYTDSQCSADTFSDWTGIYSYGTHKLAQMGMFVSHYSGTLTRGAFFEFVGGSLDTGGMAVFPGSAYTAGHTYRFNIYANDVDQPKSITFNLQDQTAESQGDYTHDSAVEYSPVDPTEYEGPTAFFISERMRMSDGKLSQYMKAAGHQFSNAGAYFGTDYLGLHDSSYDNIIMQSKDQSSTLGSPGTVSSSNAFTASWKACGTAE